MGLELELTDAQLRSIMSRNTARGYIFLREEAGRLIATKIIPVKTSNELILLSELDTIDAQIKADEAGYIPYIVGGKPKTHERCAFQLHVDNNKIAKHAAELGIPSFTNRLKGYGEIGEYDRTLRFYRFVDQTKEEIAIRRCD